MYKIDLHTYSTTSPDGGVSEQQYYRAIKSGLLDCIAITDHDRIDFALAMRQRLGEHIIVGEEIMTQEGEIIGLFLTEAVRPALTAEETIRQIKQQSGLVYIPHPFETVRKGLRPKTLEAIVSGIDIIEVCNGRAFLQNRSQQTGVWARSNNKIGAASSDAHGFHGLGKTYTIVDELPDASSLVELLQSGSIATSRPAMRSLLYPRYHRVRKKVRGTR